MHYVEVRWELTGGGLMLFWQLEATYAYGAPPAPHTRNYLHSTCYKSKLRGVIDIFEGHFCRSGITRDAATFDLMNSEMKNSFHAVLDVILLAAKIPKPDQPDAAKQTQDASEQFAISIPPMAVSQNLNLAQLSFLIVCKKNEVAS